MLALQVIYPQWFLCNWLKNIIILKSLLQCQSIFLQDYHVVSIQTRLYWKIFQQRMKQFGCQITTSENVIFKLMADAKHKDFKKIQSLVKTTSLPTGLQCGVAPMSKIWIFYIYWNNVSKDDRFVNKVLPRF